MNSTMINTTNNGSPACAGDYPTGNEPSSIHSASISEIHDIPMSEIHRPLPSILDEVKVRSLMETIQVNRIEMFSSF